MKYLCLVYRDESKLEALSQPEYDAIVGEDCDYREELRKSGISIASHALQPARAATTVRVRNGEIAIADGPVAETGEQLGQFYLIDARDLNDAIRVVARMPLARLGCVEIRPII